MTPSGPQSRKTERLVALVAIALVLFCPPLIIVVDRLPSPHIGWLSLYLFSAWAIIIGLAAWLMEHRAGR
ncbi:MULTISPECIES: hypothetical protein [Halomonadaceae]|jgi:hypothetical protein|uniref:DUF3311 domain-containing protein n=1 Tax=Vreelandella janggokensis TaxID=370767 RepID=A0ABT4ISF5_9GAMM|nr:MULTISPECIES: hypothetical protein [Halomonas]MCW4148076.1 hypothetical protein [Halomonas sp. 18H]MCZ0926593.1 hypothetical protein [Halomonas janggokensis]MCZ0929131.1 hypothetical protein [Halomonas janggokensis]MDR5885439.1 hypothetical protein [Halomonas janggokensis]QPL47990.1 hypothetical protein IT895_09745 [Halomonas sp. A40-4]